jgi:hypothetical protein
MIVVLLVHALDEVKYLMVMRSENSI